jgi:hypothetical protein
MTGRQPKPTEEAILRRLYEEQSKNFQNSPEAAEQYLRIGEHPLDHLLPVQQVAATAVLTSTMMNLDEFVTER